MLCGPWGLVSSGPVPRKQLIEAIDRVTFGEAGEDVGEIGFRIDVVEFAGFDERGYGMPNAPHRRPIPAKSAFFRLRMSGRIARSTVLEFDLYVAIIEEAGQALPA